MHKNTIKGTPTSQDSMLKIWQNPWRKNNQRDKNHQSRTVDVPTRHHHIKQKIQKNQKD